MLPGHPLELDLHALHRFVRSYNIDDSWAEHACGRPAIADHGSLGFLVRLVGN